MAKNNHRNNELYIGKELVNIEGRTIKHPALIEHYANIDTNKTRDKMIDTIGLDIETNHRTGEMRLLGFFEGNSDNYDEFILEDGDVRELGYRYYTDDFLLRLMGNVRLAIRNRKSLAHWNKLDAYQIFRLFALEMDDPENLKIALKRFDNIQGEWNSTKHEFNVLPVIAVELDGIEFGILKVIRGSLQFYIKSPSKKDIETCWSYNIASLYLNGLEKESDINHGGRFEWYSKVDESAHLVDWIRFENDKDFRENIVLKSNALDARSAMALAYEVQKDFYHAFGGYPTSLISQGSHARSAVTQQIENDLKEDGYEGDNLQERKYKEVSSIALLPTLDALLETHDNDLVKDFYVRCTESYSGGYIDTIRYGYAKEGWYADIASAYPAVIQNLYDLRGSRLESGVGEPPKIEYSYILCRGLVTIPESLQFHPITIKHPTFKDTNIRPTGTFYASYTSEERQFIIENGGTFKDETWIAIITEGKPSVLSKVSLKLVALRNKLISEKKRAEGQVKRIGNSLYGILFECVPVYEENDDLLPEKIGFRGGEFWNPLYATIITSRTRLLESKASVEIEKNGGEVILLMTDSILWKGTKDMLPRDLDLPYGKSGVKTKKTLGWYEEPEHVKDIICYGAGRYGFKYFDGEYATIKKRGMVIENFKDPKKLDVSKYTSEDYEILIDNYNYVNPDDIELEETFTWENFMKLSTHYNSLILRVITRKLISTGILAHSLKYNILDLGRIVEEKAEIDLIAGKTKRLINNKNLNPEKLSTGLVKSDAIYLDYNVYAENDYQDGTLPILRYKIKDRKMKSKKIRKRESAKKRQTRYRTKNKSKINQERKLKYKALRDAGFEPLSCSMMNNYGWDRINKIIEERLQRNGTS